MTRIWPARRGGLPGCRCWPRKTLMQGLRNEGQLAKEWRHLLVATISWQKTLKCVQRLLWGVSVSLRPRSLSATSVCSSITCCSFGQTKAATRAIPHGQARTLHGVQSNRQLRTSPRAAARYSLREARTRCMNSCRKRWRRKPRPGTLFSMHRKNSKQRRMKRCPSWGRGTPSGEATWRPSADDYSPQAATLRSRCYVIGVNQRSSSVYTSVRIWQENWEYTLNGKTHAPAATWFHVSRRAGL